MEFMVKNDIPSHLLDTEDMIAEAQKQHVINVSPPIILQSAAAPKSDVNVPDKLKPVRFARPAPLRQIAAPLVLTEEEKDARKRLHSAMAQNETSQLVGEKVSARKIALLNVKEETFDSALRGQLPFVMFVTKFPRIERPKTKEGAPMTPSVAFDGVILSIGKDGGGEEVYFPHVQNKGELEFIKKYFDKVPYAQKSPQAYAFGDNVTNLKLRDKQPEKRNLCAGIYIMFNGHEYSIWFRKEDGKSHEISDFTKKKVEVIGGGKKKNTPGYTLESFIGDIVNFDGTESFKKLLQMNRPRKLDSYVENDLVPIPDEYYVNIHGEKVPNLPKLPIEVILAAERSVKNTVWFKICNWHYLIEHDEEAKAKIIAESGGIDYFVTSVPKMQASYFYVCKMLSTAILPEGLESSVGYVKKAVDKGYPNIADLSGEVQVDFLAQTNVHTSSTTEMYSIFMTVWDSEIYKLGLYTTGVWIVCGPQIILCLDTVVYFDLLIPDSEYKKRFLTDDEKLSHKEALKGVANFVYNYNVTFNHAGLLISIDMACEIINAIYDTGVKKPLMRDVSKYNVHTKWAEFNKMTPLITKGDYFPDCFCLNEFSGDVELCFVKQLTDKTPFCYNFYAVPGIGFYKGKKTNYDVIAAQNFNAKNILCREAKSFADNEKFIRDNWYVSMGEITIFAVKYNYKV